MLDGATWPTSVGVFGVDDTVPTSLPIHPVDAARSTQSPQMARLGRARETSALDIDHGPSMRCCESPPAKMATATRSTSDRPSGSGCAPRPHQRGEAVGFGILARQRRGIPRRQSTGDRESQPDDLAIRTRCKVPLTYCGDNRGVIRPGNVASQRRVRLKFTWMRERDRYLRRLLMQGNPHARQEMCEPNRLNRFQKCL